MNAVELRQKTDAELRVLLDTELHEGFQLRMRHYTGQLDNTSQLKSNRRTIARIRTILAQRAQASE